MVNGRNELETTVFSGCDRIRERDQASRRGRAGPGMDSRTAVLPPS